MTRKIILSRSLAPHIFNLATVWKRVVRITPWPFHPHGKSSHYTRGKKLGKPQNSSKHTRKHRNISLLGGLEPKFLCCPVHSPAFGLMGKNAYWSVSREFAKLRKATSNFAKLVSFSVSIRPSVCNNSVPTGRILMKFDIWGFSKISRENSVLNKIWRE